MREPGLAWYYSSMRRLVSLLLLLAISALLLGCDTTGPPAPTAAATNTAVTPTPAPTQRTQQPTDAEENTDTMVAPTDSPQLEKSPTAPPAIPSPQLFNMKGPPPAGWKEVQRAPPGKRRIAITFDAGASGATIPQILATLRAHHLHITMFITGKFAEQYPQGIQQAALDGNEIANHTYSHLDSTKLSDARLEQELQRTDDILQKLTGKTTKPYWRPPYGARNNHVLDVAVSQGYRSIYWTLDTLDSVGQPKTPDFIFNRVTNPPPGVQLDGAIILQHFGSQASADALPRELDRLQAMGLQVVTVSQLLAP